jgi:hypothetical protein
MTLDRLIAEARSREVDLLAAAEQADSWDIAGRGLPALSEMAAFLRLLSSGQTNRPTCSWKRCAQDQYRGGCARRAGGLGRALRPRHRADRGPGAMKSPRRDRPSPGSSNRSHSTQVDDLTRAGEARHPMTGTTRRGWSSIPFSLPGWRRASFHVSSFTDPREMEEERLFYVAATRACRRLF